LATLGGWITYPGGSPRSHRQKDLREIAVAHLPEELLAAFLDHRQHRAAIQRLADCLCREGIKGTLQRNYLAVATVVRLVKLPPLKLVRPPGERKKI